ncbi:MAG: PP2C family protein-serine/threonine phosphatase [Melioribacter sp.]|uniref:PP2C family protein-serine/threonine phosphatase n=1 Tax=Rosettibacter primus TaxID=3111523 RepID=UPI00247DB74B|nr:PP2C family protein-serine/threonine phosphatase [Melioribacter sp.]
MLDPKTFHRKLDSLLSKIGQEKSGKDFLSTIVTELEKTFGYDLHIGNGRIYEERDNEYVLIFSKENHPMEKIPADSKAVQLLLKSKTYIFDNPEVSIDNTVGRNGEYRIPAAITVRGKEQRWIFIFDLMSGWIREEIELCLNAVRTVLNYRLTSEAVKSEMEQAVQIQQSLLPLTAPEFEGLTIAGRSIPAEMVGGDLYDYFNFDNEVFGVCIGDASGHGLPAALLVRDVVTGLRMGLEKHLKMVYTFKKLNNVIYRSVYSTSFVSLFYAEIEKNGNIIYVNAGHPAPLLYDGNEFIELDSTGLIFGALPEINIHRGHAFMKPNSLLILYSDGIIERKNSNENDFDITGLKKIIKEHFDKTPEQLLDIIFDTLYVYGGGKKWDDDATVVIVRRDK